MLARFSTSLLSENLALCRDKDLLHQMVMLALLDRVQKQTLEGGESRGCPSQEV